LSFIRVQKMSWGIEISNIDLSYKKHYERCIKLWIMYGFTLVNLSFFYDKLYVQNYVVTPICKLFWPNLDIIEIIMW
jgi:hypothetical protein